MTCGRWPSGTREIPSAEPYQKRNRLSRAQRRRRRHLRWCCGSAHPPMPLIEEKGSTG
jgi:hypothetical protein